MSKAKKEMIQNLHSYKSPQELAEGVAFELTTLIGHDNTKAFHLALSGGNTPDLLFTVLSQKYADPSLWHHVHFWWADERMVPPDDEQSNYGTANKLLFSGIPVPTENIHRIKGENNPEAEALFYSDQIHEKLTFQNGWPVFNLILLGMGEDGHTASIFPNQMQLLQSDRICEVAVHPQSHQKRITLTGHTINSALKVWFIVSGANKAERLKELSLGHEHAKLLPAAHIRPENGKLAWYVDEAAIQAI